MASSETLPSVSVGIAGPSTHRPIIGREHRGYQTKLLLSLHILRCGDVQAAGQAPVRPIMCSIASSGVPMKVEPVWSCTAM